LASGKKAATYLGVGFASLAQMLAVITPKRLELVAELHARGPMSVAALARVLERDYENVHGGKCPLRRRDKSQSTTTVVELRRRVFATHK
jgi:predicted transcriptional regulator